MHYDAIIRREGKYVLAEFPDCPGCQTFAGSADELASAAQDALEGWLEAHLVGRQIPPRPREQMRRAPMGAKLAHVPVRAGLAAALGVRWARQDAGLTQAELGKLAGVTQQQIAKLEDPDENPSLDTLERIAKALGRGVDVALESAVRLSVPPPRRRRAMGR